MDSVIDLLIGHLLAFSSRDSHKIIFDFGDIRQIESLPGVCDDFALTDHGGLQDVTDHPGVDGLISKFCAFSGKKFAPGVVDDLNTDFVAFLKSTLLEHDVEFLYSSCYIPIMKGHALIV